MPNPLAPDLDRLLQLTAALGEDYRGARILLTGGTGFFGGWLLGSLLHLDQALDLGVRVTVLTRDPTAFARSRPHLAHHPAVSLLAGDVLTLEPISAEFSHVVHAATPASTRVNLETPRLMFDTIVEGTRRVLAAARSSRARRVLLTSSGAIYGPQPAESTHLPEDYTGGPDPCAPGASYGEGKRAAELLSALAWREHGLEVVIARCFAFAGPYLPLDAHFAIGNFVRDAMAGGPIRVRGDGTAVRSYLYGGDLAAWLWTLLVRGRPATPYNVGSETAITIAELARTVARTLGTTAGVEIAQEPDAARAPDRYVPCTLRARVELGLEETFDLETSIRRMAAAAGV